MDLTSDHLWHEAKRDYPIGKAVEVVIQRHQTFGMLVVVPGIPGVSAVIDMASYQPDGQQVTDHSTWPRERSRIKAVVSDHVDRSRQLRFRVGPPFEEFGATMTASRDNAINWALLDDLADKPHRNLNTGPQHADLPVGVGEALMEARTAHHLLDLIEIPLGKGYAASIDARVYQAITRLMTAEERLGRIGAWHSREIGPAGMVGDLCAQCGDRWPCDDRRLVDGEEVEELPATRRRNVLITRERGDRKV